MSLLGDDKPVNISEVLNNMHFLKTKLTCSRFFSEINTYSFIEFILNFSNALYIQGGTKVSNIGCNFLI
jgi:hypothetical protein